MKTLCEITSPCSNAVPLMTAGSSFMAKALSEDGGWNLHSRKVSFVARTRAARVAGQTHGHTRGSLLVVPVLACTQCPPLAPNLPIHLQE